VEKKEGGERGMERLRREGRIKSTLLVRKSWRRPCYQTIKMKCLQMKMYHFSIYLSCVCFVCEQICSAFPNNLRSSPSKPGMKMRITKYLSSDWSNAFGDPETAGGG
jgi:hypothetical protein